MQYLLKRYVPVITGGLLLTFFAILSLANPYSRRITSLRRALADTTKKDSLTPTRPKLGRNAYLKSQYHYGNRFSDKPVGTPFLLKEGPSLNTEFRLDQDRRMTIYERFANGLNYRAPETMEFDQYSKIQDHRVNIGLMRSYAAKSEGKSDVTGRGLLPKLDLGSGLDRLFGGNAVDFKPNGYVLLDFGILGQNIDNPAIPIQQRRTVNFIFNEQAAINFNGKIGDKMNLNANFDTRAAFNFENKLKLNYKASEEDIIQKIEAGNVNLPLNSQLIPGVQNLFGLKTQLRFGRLDATLIASQQRSKKNRLVIRGGSMAKPFEIRCDQYDENRHFFLSQYFRSNYERALKNLPVITSGVTITRLEVYVTNRTNTTESLRNLVGFADLAENSPYARTNPNLQPINTTSPADNKANGLFDRLISNTTFRQVDQTSFVLENNFQLQKGTDYEILRGAKRLTDREYRFHPELGYISLVTPLRNDEILAVAYEYTLNGRKYKVGELTEDYQARNDDEVMVLKMLKSSTIRNNLTLPMWNLMMKNVYSLNTSQLSKQNFQFRIIYKDDLTGIDNPNLQEGRRMKDVPLIQVMGLDRLNPAGDPPADGNFDFVEGTTVDSRNGKIIFPVLEPFGSNLRKQFDADESYLVEKYVHDKLYRSTLIDAQQVTEKNKFFLKGSFQAGSGAEITLPYGVDANSVQVSSGGAALSPSQDFQVESGSGRVRITNESIMNSGREIIIEYEQPDLFNNQIRTLLGGRFDYTIGKDVHLGATVLKYKETPPANLRRVAIGNEPTNNTIIGVDAAIRKKSEFLTRMLDKLPLLSTKETSAFEFQGEYAQLFAGVAPRVQNNSFIDDFEGARTIYDLTRQPTLWRLGSTPKTFPQGSLANPLEYGYRRAKLSVYTVDNTFYGLGGGFGFEPTNITQQDLSNHYEKQVQPQAIFANKAIANGFNIPLGLLDIAYYPTERGQYNYNPDLTADGKLKNPRQNFGAATRAVTSDIDFDNANIENVEFWMMDPFINDPRGVVRATGNAAVDKPNTTGGKFLINLGDISEDVIPDGRYNFENGLPLDDKRPATVGNLQRNVDATPWGYATRSQFVTKAFSNQAGAREKQDIGLDGLTDDEEKSYLKTSFLDKLPANLTPQARQEIEADPAGDNFEFYFSEKANTEDWKILRRYKNYMGMDKNSPETNFSQNQVSETNNYLPDVEDINNDNTINDNESYYQYQLDLQPGQLQVGKGYVVDKVTDPDGANWYLFRVPIRNFTGKVGNINGFKSIRFIRFVMTDFLEPVVLRFAQMQLTGYQYRKYTGNLTGRGLTEVPEPYDAQFQVQTVSIEENGAGNKNNSTTTPYAVPPGFERDRDLTTINNAELNEQSMSLSVKNLRDGDSRAVFKNTNLDLQFYKRLRMFVHMENDLNENDKVSAFIRLGTDLTDNYYEVEVKELKATDPGSVSKTTPEPEKVWPQENEFDVPFNELRRVKTERDRVAAALTVPYTIEVPDETIAGKSYKITVVGRPDLSAVMAVMIGMRNPKSADEQPKSFKIWVDELRAHDFDQTSGGAAVGKLNLKLADFATVQVTGGFRNFGFGGVQDKISQRARETTTEYGIAANIQLDKLLPEKWGIKLPMYVTYDHRNIKPHFNPLDPDVPLETSLQNLPDAARRDAYRKLVEDNTTRRGINFSNVRKMRMNPNAKPHFYDVENLSFTYAFSETNRSSILIDEYRALSHRGAITYAFTNQPRSYEPFKNVKAFDRPWLMLLKEANFTLAPSSVTVQADMDRSFVKTQLRNSDLSITGVNPLFEKYWWFNRRYDMTWNFTKNIVLNYNAQANAIIDEPRGDLDTQAKRDSVMANLLHFGRTKNYDQRVSATYRIPFDKFPLTDWVTGDYSYRAGYNFTAASYQITDSLDVPFGNVLRNNRDQTLTGRIDFVKLYNKVKYLNLANSPRLPRRNIARNPGDMEEFQLQGGRLLKDIARLLMAVRGINFSYNVQESTILPGFLPQVSLFGLSKSTASPGVPFLLGSQDPNIRFRAAENGWLSKSTVQNTPFAQTVSKTFTANTQIEPWKDFKIQLQAKLTRTDNYTELFRPTTLGGAFESQSPVRSGNFSMSFLSFGTSFRKLETDNSSPIFQEFNEYRQIILKRLKEANVGAGEYNDKSQDVLIPAFFAAYAGRDPNKVSFSPFYKIPFPNWRLDYNGLGNLEPFKRTFSSINITHSFTSTYSVGNFVSSLEYDARFVAFTSPLYPFPTQVNSYNQFVPVYVMSVIQIQEKFAPFLGIQIRTKKNVTGRLEYNQERTVSLNLSNAQVAELSDKALVIAFGFTRNNFRLPFRVGGRTVTLKNDLKFDFNFTIRDSRAVQRKLDGESIITAGNYNFQLRPQVNYKVNKRLSVTAYFDRMINNPLVTNSFRRATAQGGIQVRFDLAQ
ncbi:MAG: cell surface protein SprA [Spirosomataceae bacterium]